MKKSLSSALVLLLALIVSSCATGPTTPKATVEGEIKMVATEPGVSVTVTVPIKEKDEEVALPEAEETKEEASTIV
ncbi:MAG: hypothetical protein ACI4S4_00595, partial [Candidatus Ornithospirochaeta sp.]